MINKFKKGDRVKVLTMPSECRGTFPQERVGEVFTISYAGECYCINNNEWGCNFYENELELEDNTNNTKFKKGDEVKRICGDHMGMRKGDIATILSVDYNSLSLKGYRGTHSIINFELVKNKIEVNKMELKEIKKDNLVEAKKQFQEESMNEEVEVAKQSLRNATDNADRIDREIKAKVEEKQPYLDIIKQFK